MSRIAFRDFSKYLHLSIPADEIPPNALRRARGVHPVKTGSVRSRPGCSQVNALHANSVFVFGGIVFTFTGAALYRAGVNILTLSASTLSFLSFPPTASKLDYLFISNGGALYKIDTSGTVTKWGIDAPPDGFTAANASASSTTINACDDATDWSATSCSVVDDATNYVEGSGSIQVQVAQNATGNIVDSNSIDLSASSDADYICFWLLIDNPDNLASVELQFSLGDTTFGVNLLSYSLDYNSYSPLPNSMDATQSINGLGGTDNYSTPDEERSTQTLMYETTNPLYAQDGYLIASQRSALQQTALPVSSTSVWTPIRIAKGSFMRSGEDAYDWSDVEAVRFVVKANSLGAVNVNIDKLEMVGGNGMQGDYKYYITYLNNNTGSRSNPNPNPVLVTNNLRQEVDIAALPTPSDTQVTHVEIWRTVGGGAIPFKAAEVAAGTATFTDTVADCYVLDPSTGATLLSDTSIEFNNIVPPATLGYCEKWQAAVFWTNTASANAGNLYYSRTGYSEANEGFIRVTTSNDPLQRPIVWNGTLYVFSIAGCYMVWGGNPYYNREVSGVPGTSWPATVVATPYGIMYRALDGIRLFNGTRSELIGWLQLSKLLSGEDVENLTSFEGTCATWGKNEYYISDGTQTLVYHPRDDTWRDVGLGFDCLFTDPLTKQVYGGNATGVYILETPGLLDDAGTAIPFEVETKQLRLDVDREVMVNYLFLDANTGGQALTITAITEQGNVSYGVLNTSTRSTVVVPINHSYQRFGVRLAGSLTAAVEIFGIELEAEISQALLTDRYFKGLLSV